MGEVREALETLAGRDNCPSKNQKGVATLRRRVDKSGNSPESPTTWARRDGRAKTLMRPDMRTRPCMRDILISPVFVHL